jgi:DNA uptake protein ComE-like DNA-binding protein
MKSLKSHLIFNRSQRSGILFLVILITGLLVVYYFLDFSENNILDTNSAEVRLLKKEIDSLRELTIEARKPKHYFFNPNFITDFKAYTLGLTPKEYDRLQQFRSKDQWINSIADFKRITKVSDTILATISPYFKFPEWVSKPRVKQKDYLNGFSKITYDQKVDLNTTTAIQLQKVNGIGKVLSERIIIQREKLGGFTSEVQLFGIWGLNEEVIGRIVNLFAVKTPKAIEKMNLNTATASDIATIPGISFDLAKEIWEFRILRDRVYSFSELEKIQSLSSGKLSLIQLYLFVH